MSFSSLLPPPRNCKAASKEASSSNRELVVRALTEIDGDQEEVVQHSNVINSVVASKLNFQDFVPIRQRNFNMELPKPSKLEIEETYKRTKKAFDKILASLSKPDGTGVKSSTQVNADAYELKYDTLQPSGAVRSRSLKIVEHAQDPLQPSQVKAGKVVAPPVEEPLAPILHKTDSTETSNKLSKEERERWNIPAAISSWKNPKGYTISLERRLDMDARYNKQHTGAQEVNMGFAKLSNALDVAEREARQEIKLRAEAKRQLADEELRQKELKLKLLAQKAREEREYQRMHPPSRKRLLEQGNDFANEREIARNSRRMELDKDLRRSKMSTADRLRELAYSQGRDVSEKVILGAAKATDAAGDQYDSRLLAKGASSGARVNEGQLYDRPLFDQQLRDSSNRANLEQIESFIRQDKRDTNGPIEFTPASENNEEQSKEYGLQKK
ncbi:hypothetical protein HG536_0F04100 [Torulaspora globosa]|uniref:Pre-mRNA-processing protein 45 n=1 Tax=Torulaspora globosa TaxID=48254 RepID=A0A7G3ZKP8_9SACH|nr:uncharacterized protein HG536_0F04100 [Torulaspora globosa]QLL34084.1 hypothetical protein HG536_0F04100 [Torulaspora globosa]